MAIHIEIFRSPEAAQQAFDALRAEGFALDQLTVLAPSATSTEIPPGSPVETDAPGAHGVNTGEVAGSIMGWAGGVASAAVTLFVLPAVGPIAVVGTLALASVLGATVGGAAGYAVQHAATQPFPHDHAFVYEDALRRGRWLLIVQAADEHQLKTTLRILDFTDTESFDNARETWWRFLRTTEAQEAKASSQEFTNIEPLYREGFEAALAPDLRGHSHAEAFSTLQERYPESYNAEPFIQGYQRGQVYFAALLERYYEKQPSK